MKKTLSLLALILTLSGCVHKMDIEQGNIITEDKIARLHTGMTEDQVQTVLGTPMLINTFDGNRLDYVYTIKEGHGKMSKKSVNLFFKNHRLRQIGGE